MAETYFPFDSGTGAAVTEEGWMRMARNMRPSGIWGDVLNNSLQVKSSSSNLTSVVNPGEAFLVGFQYVSDAEIALTHNPNTSGQPRIDRIVLRLDRTQKKIYPTVIQGQPSATPAIPAMLGDHNAFTSTSDPGDLWDIPLADVLITNGATVIPSGNYTDRRWLGSFATTTGTTQNTNPNWGMRPFGSIHYQNDIRRWMAWDGIKWSVMHETGPWRTFTPKLYWNLSTGLSQSTTWQMQGRYRYTGDNTIEFAISAKATATISIPSGEGADGPMQISLPFTSGNYGAGNDHIVNVMYVPGDNSSKTRAGLGVIWPNSNVINQIWTNHVTSSPDSQTGTLDQVVKSYGFPTNSTVRISGTYETAGA